MSPVISYMHPGHGRMSNTVSSSHQNDRGISCTAKESMAILTTSTPRLAMLHARDTIARLLQLKGPLLTSTLQAELLLPLMGHTIKTVSPSTGQFMWEGAPEVSSPTSTSRQGQHSLLMAYPL